MKPVSEPPISVLVLTKNEEYDLPECLASVAWSKDIHIVDSGSTDATVDIAEAAGATVTVRAFDGYASQRNFGLQLPFKNDWVLTLDADERIPPALVTELGDFIQTVPRNVAAGRIRRRDFWWGRWLRHAQISPYYVRLTRVGRVHYERQVNEVPVVDGEIRDLRQPFDHFPFSKGLDHWVEKHNRYSRMEAEMIAGGNPNAPSLRTALFSADFNERRVHQKAIFYKLPGRPFVKFAYMILARRAFLDGWPGVRYALLQSIYEYLIVLKTKEIQQRRTP